MTETRVEADLRRFDENDTEDVASSKCRVYKCRDTGLPPDGFCAHHEEAKNRVDTEGHRGLWHWVNVVGPFEDVEEP